MGILGNIGDFLWGDDPEVATPKDRRILSINTPGFTTSQSGNTLNFNRTGVVDDLLKGFRGFSTTAAGDIRGLRDQVVPGFGALTAARVGAVQDAREKAMSNLGDNLRRRRVSGSSFGNDAMTRAESEFGKLEGQVRAESKLKELAMTQSLIDRELQISTKAIQTELIQMLNEGKIASGLAGVAQQAATDFTQILNDASQAQAELEMDILGNTKDVLGSFLGFGADRMWPMPKPVIK
tara:strand:- start:1487 stop:2197 length:711 start_codon:yes stop_codon:yes gene_type:complete